MPRQIQRVRVLLSSPGNLTSDRQAVGEVAGQINEDSGRRDGFHIEVVAWETHTRPAAGDEPQAVINQQFPDDVDIYLGMLGVYFGTPTKNWGSGTEEEYRLAYASWERSKSPEIMFYFSDNGIPPSEIDAEQFRLCTEFKKEIGQMGVKYDKYRDLAEFKVLLHRQLSDAVYAVLDKGSKIAGTQEPPEHLRDKLPNYERLRIECPAIVVEDILSDSSSYLEHHAKEMDELNLDVKRFSRDLDKLVKQLNNSASEERKGEVFSKIIRALDNYQHKLRRRVPVLRDDMEASLVGAQRAANIVKLNKLYNIFPLDQLLEPLKSMESGLQSLSPVILDLNENIKQFPDGNDIGRLKLRLIALHQDFLEYLENSLHLIGKTAACFSDEQG